VTHYRTTIRDAVASILTGLTTTGDRVYKSRYYAYDPAKGDGINGPGPALLIYTIEESSGIDSMGPSRPLLRELSLVIESVVQINETLDDTLDTICAEVESALANESGRAFTLGDIVQDHYLASTAIAFRGEGEAATGGAVMTFVVKYRTPQKDPATAA
jgi:hypothetical protein